MLLVKEGYEILTPLNGKQILKDLEKVMRVCYKSEDRITDDSAPAIIKKWALDHKHESTIEHHSITVKFTTNRGVSHELVRHRLASFAQESTRYCNYGMDKFQKQLKFIKPSWLSLGHKHFNVWMDHMEACEKTYMKMLELGFTAQEARGVLPNDLKTEIIVTANIREWRHIFKMRTAKAAHPDMRVLMIPLLKEFKERIPVLFDDIETPET